MIFDISFKESQQLTEAANLKSFDAINDEADGGVSLTIFENYANIFEEGAKMAARAARDEIWTVYRVFYNRDTIQKYLFYFIGHYGAVANRIERLEDK
jgi:hypothetical protein